MKMNYQLETDRCLAALPPEEKPTLLLHSCCGPCSSYVLEYLTKYFDVTILYYNPNIQPEAEYEKRLFYQREVLRHIPARILECSYDGPAFEEIAAGKWDHLPEQAFMYVGSIEQAAEQAEKMEFEAKKK